MFEKKVTGGSEKLPPPEGDESAKVKTPMYNFAVDVRKKVNVHYGDGTKLEQRVKYRFVFDADSISDELIDSVSKLENVDFLNKDPRCRYDPAMNPRKVQRYIADSIREALLDAEEETLWISSKLGNDVIAGTPVFNDGRSLIKPLAGIDGDPIIGVAPSPFNLDVDPVLNEEDAAVGMIEIISLFANAGRIILAQMLSFLMSAVYKDAWKSPCSCVFLYGKTGTKKTTVSAFLTQLYNRANGIANPVRLNASIPAAVRILYEKNDCVVVLDDLFPADSKNIQRKQEETLSEITRVIADGIPPARVRGNEVAKEPPNCGVLFTGEYIIGFGSDAARLLPVEMTPPDCEKLKRFQDQPLLVSTFFRFFIQWYISNYSDIKNYLKEWHDVYREVSLGVHARLQETHFFMNTAYALLMQYCCEIEIVSRQDARKMHRSFLDLLNDLIKDQQHRVDQGRLNTTDGIDYLAQIRTLLKSGKFSLAAEVEQFDDGIHDGVIHNGELCLRKKHLSRFFPTVSIDTVKMALLLSGALRRGTDRDEIQIAGTNGKRFIAIPLVKLT